MSKWVQHNKCRKGRAVEEVDGVVYCFGILDGMYEDTVYREECKRCPRLLANNEDKIKPTNNLVGKVNITY
jgi:hypothetical protein